MLPYFLPITIAAALAGAPGVAPQYDRRSRDEPEIVVQDGGRSGACDALTFDPTGRFLLAGGDDKAVRVWPYVGGKLDTTRGTTLRWRAWRDQRGGIKAVATSPDGTQVAIGGYGMKPATVAVLDRATGELLGLTWPRADQGGEEVGPVMAVAFHPDGKQVAFGTADGSLWLWTVELRGKADADGRPSPLPRLLGKHAPLLGANKAPAAFNRPRLLSFPDGTTLLSVAQNGEVVRCDLTADAPPAAAITRVLNVFDELGSLPGPPQPGRSIRRAELTRDGKWLVAADIGARVWVRSLDGKTLIEFPLPEDYFPRAIAVDPRTRRLAIGVGSALPVPSGQPRFFAEGHDQIWVFPDLTRKSDPRVILHTGPAEMLAFHPTDDRLAVAGGDADEVTLLDLGAPQKSEVSVARGAGRRVWGVALSESGDVLGIRPERDATSTDPNDRAGGPWVRFNVSRLDVPRDDTRPWAKPLRKSGGWTIVPHKTNRFVWRAIGPGSPVDGFPLNLDVNRDLAPTCFAFLPPAENKPTCVLVGHYYGCTLFELTAAGATPKKLFTGHSGEVLSLAVARQGTWFVTGGADHMVAAYSLADWPGKPGLGAKFEATADRVVVKTVAIGGPAYEAGLRVGDSLDLLAVNGDLTFSRRPRKTPAGSPIAAVAALEKARPGIELYFGWVPEGGQDRRESLTTVRQRPLWKWFPAFDDRGRLTDWVIWMWQGSYYHTKSAHGDRLVGWHVNHPTPGGPTTFYQLQQFEKAFHRREVIEKLVNTRDVAAALADAAGGNPLPPTFSQFEPAPVRLGLPLTTVGREGLTANVSVHPRGSNPDLLPTAIELWVNDHRFQTWPGNAQEAFQTTVTIPASVFRAGENQISVITLNPVGGRAEDHRTVTNPRAPSAANIRAVAVGVDDYSANRKAAGGARDALGDLACAGKDARSVADALKAFRGPKRWFPGGEVDLRLAPDAARGPLLDALKDAAHRASADDLLVVYFAGHGDLLPPAPGNRAEWDRPFVFCCPNYTPRNPAATALSAQEVFGVLAGAKCRKVVLLDACHSGQAVDANMIRRFVPNGQGPFVIAACDQSEQSYENSKIGHGVFTESVLEAFGPRFAQADTDTNGELTADELFAYIYRRVPGLLQEIGKSGDLQNPICFPRTPPRFTIVKP